MVSRRRAPDYLPRDILARPDFAKACADRKLGAMLRIAHKWGGFSKYHLARRCQMTPTQIQDYMVRGRTAVSLEIFERVADGLHIPGKMLGIGDRPWETGDGSPDERRSADWGFLTPWTVGGTLDSARTVSEVDPVDRRSFMFLTGAAVTAPAHDWLLAHPVKNVSGSGGRQVRPELVNVLDEYTGELRRMDDEMGGGTLVSLVSAQAGYVTTLLREGAYTDAVGRRLHMTLGELLRLGGWVSYDSGHQAQAQRFWIAALHAAHTAGDRALGANVLRFMSVQAQECGQPGDALRLARTALEGCKGGSPRVSAILHSTAARAYALTGQAAGSERAIDAARSALGDARRESDEPGWSYWMDDEALEGHAGICSLALGDYPSACHYLETSVPGAAGEQRWYARDVVARLVMLATAHARNGEPEQACAVGTRAADLLSGQVDSARLIAALRKFHRELRFCQDMPAVREFGDRLGELARRPSRQQQPPASPVAPA